MEWVGELLGCGVLSENRTRLQYKTRPSRQAYPSSPPRTSLISPHAQIINTNRQPVELIQSPSIESSSGLWADRYGFSNIREPPCPPIQFEHQQRALRGPHGQIQQQIRVPAGQVLIARSQLYRSTEEPRETDPANADIEIPWAVVQNIDNRQPAELLLGSRHHANADRRRSIVRVGQTTLSPNSQQSDHFREECSQTHSADSNSNRELAPIQTQDSRVNGESPRWTVSSILTATIQFLSAPPLISYSPSAPPNTQLEPCIPDSPLVPNADDSAHCTSTINSAAVPRHDCYSGPESAACEENNLVQDTKTSRPPSQDSSQTSVCADGNLILNSPSQSPQNISSPIEVPEPIEIPEPVQTQLNIDQATASDVTLYGSHVHRTETGNVVMEIETDGPGTVTCTVIPSNPVAKQILDEQSDCQESCTEALNDLPNEELSNQTTLFDNAGQSDEKYPRTEQVMQLRPPPRAVNREVCTGRAKLRIVSDDRLSEHLRTPDANQVVDGIAHTLLDLKSSTWQSLRSEPHDGWLRHDMFTSIPEDIRTESRSIRKNCILINVNREFAASIGLDAHTLTNMDINKQHPDGCSVATEDQRYLNQALNVDLRMNDVKIHSGVSFEVHSYGRPNTYGIYTIDQQEDSDDIIPDDDRLRPRTRADYVQPIEVAVDSMPEGLPIRIGTGLLAVIAVRRNEDKREFRVMSSHELQREFNENLNLKISNACGHRHWMDIKSLLNTMLRFLVDDGA